MKNRIAPVDGLRAFAVLGVMWAHVWMFYNNVGFRIGPVDIQRLISFGGIGVDLFFVISGFCMYHMYARKTTGFVRKEYGEFLAKRWRRIAPAFYFVVIFECLLYLIKSGSFPFTDFLSHLFFVNTFITENKLSPPFWSLATEWQFYLLLPFLFINDPFRKKIWPRLIILMVVCFVFRAVLFYIHAGDVAAGVTVQSDKIWYRFIEFGWGIMAAKMYADGISLPGILKGHKGFIISFMIAYAGRLLMATEVVNKFHSAAFFVRALGDPLLTFGFGIMLLNVISSTTVFSRFLSLKIFQFLGRISYSMYLWHWIICASVSTWLLSKQGVSALYMNIAYLLCVVAVIPVAMLSYRWFEAPYFKKSPSPQTSPVLQEVMVENLTDKELLIKGKDGFAQ